MVGLSTPAHAQIYRVGAGLCFASGYEFNSIAVGNPGVKVKTWIALDRLSTIHIVPTLVAFNRNVMDAGFKVRKLGDGRWDPRFSRGEWESSQ